MSTGGGPNSEIAKLSIGIEATGADAATQKLKDVEQQAKQTAAAIHSSSISGPRHSPVSSSIIGPGMMPGGAGALRDAAMDWSSYNVKLDAATEARQRFIQTSARATQTIQQEAQAVTGLSSALRPLAIFGRVSAAVGFFTAALAQGYEGIQKYRSAAEDLNNELKKIGESFKINTTVGVSESDMLKKQADATKEAALAAEKLRVKERGWREGFWETVFGEPANKAILQQIDTDHKSALEQIAVREKNQRDKDEADKQEAREKETAKYNEELEKRKQKERMKAGLETEDLRQQVLVAGMSEREKVIDKYQTKILEAYRHIAETEDATIKNTYAERIGYLNQLRNAELKVIDEREQKEIEAAKQRKQDEVEAARALANAAAEAYSAAIESASRSAADAMRSQLDISGISTQLEGVTDLLDMIARQRGVR